MINDTAAHLDLLDEQERHDFTQDVDVFVCGQVQGDHVCTSSIDHVDDDESLCHCPCGFDF